MTTLFRSLLGLAFALGTACATAGSSGGTAAPRGDPRVVTESDLAEATQQNLYDYLSAERPHWLRGFVPAKRGGLDVTVFSDDTRLGSVQTLKTVSIGSVRMVRYYEPAAAQQKFGRDIGAVIQIVNR